MVTADSTVLAPKVLIVPSNVTEDANAVDGEIKISGAKLYFFSGAAFKLVTSA